MYICMCMCNVSRMSYHARLRASGLLGKNTGFATAET